MPGRFGPGHVGLGPGSPFGNLYVRTWTDGLVSIPALNVNVQEWWNLALQVAVAAKKSGVVPLLIYTTWNIWNKRNRSIFQGVYQAPQRILGLIK